MTKTEQAILKKELKRSEEFNFFSDEELDYIVDFLDHQGIATIEDALDRHYEPSERDMFNWMWEDSMRYVEPMKIHEAALPHEDGRILMFPDGRCILWYEILVFNEPYNPFKNDSHTPISTTDNSPH